MKIVVPLPPQFQAMDYTIDFSKITQYDNLEFVAKQVVEGFITGIHKSPMHGFSVEFAEHQPSLLRITPDPYPT